MLRHLLGLCAMLMLLAIAPTVKADPVVITSGSLTVIGIFGSPTYSFSGQNFSVTAVSTEPGNSPNCLPCASSGLTSLSSFFVGTSLGDGTATINGTTFNNVEFLGEFSFGVTPVMLPVGTTNLTITAPFSFSGNIRGCNDNVVCTTEIFSTVELVGQGIATAQFDFVETLGNGVSLYQFRSITYTFQDAAVPEPMTISLLLTGLIGLSAKVRYRRRSS